MADAEEPVLSRYVSRLEPEAEEARLRDAEAALDLGCFGWLRGSRERAVMLVLKKASGNCLAIPYAFIERIEFDPSDGILIQAGATAIEIIGLGLNAEVRPNVRLFEGLTRQRVSWVAEQPTSEAREAVLVMRVQW